MPEQALHKDTFDKQIPSKAGTIRRRRFILLLMLVSVLIAWWWLNAQNAEGSDGIHSYTRPELIESGRVGLHVPRFFTIDF